jgi:N-acetylglucosaminyldiphosphoundecaprenol N-acetyl-beta-D-mannosaminyltransferase
LRSRKARRALAARTAQLEKPPFKIVPLPSRLDFEEVHQARESLEAAVTADQPCVLDLRALEFIDSTGVGLLIRLQKRARYFGQQLILAGANEKIRRALQLMKLEEFFVMVPDLTAAENCLREIGQYASVHLKTSPSSPLPVLAWTGELTAANAEEVWIATMDYLAARSLVQRALTIDLSKLQFIDSTGLSVMIRAKKYGARQAMKIRFTEPHPNVLNVIRLSRLEDYLLKNQE